MKRIDPKIVFMLLILVLLFPGCSVWKSDSSTQQLTVFAASSLTDAMDALASTFENNNPDVKVLRHYASSSQLAAQLVEGAYADVYASANEIQMARVVSAGLVDGAPVAFTANHLALIVPADNPAGIHSLQDLAKPGISLVLAAPDVPVRVYSDQLIAAFGDAQYQNAVYANLVSEEINVRQVVAKIALGEADAGFVYVSDITPDVADRLTQISIPSDLNITAQYPIAVISGSKNVGLSNAFNQFVLSPEGQAILAEWGFAPLPNGE